ncbi:MAG: PDZ domain-containing protein [Kiritimatiellia bacterium]
MHKRISPALLIASLTFSLQAATLDDLPPDEILDLDAPDATITAVPHLQQSMVQVRAAIIQAEVFLPWRNSTPSWQTGYAVAVAPGVFLTPEPLVRNHADLQVRRAGSVQQIPAEVILSDPRVGLALIRAVEEDWFPDAIPLRFVDVIPQQGDFRLARWGDNDHLQTGAGSLLSIGFDSIGNGVPAQLTFTIASSLRVTHSGTPVIHNGQLAGLAIESGRAARGILALAPESINRFLEAARNNDYTGVPEPTFEGLSLADPVRRRFLGVPEEYRDRGIYISAARPQESNDYGLRREDVLLAWDGMDLDASGNYQHPAYGRIPFQHLVAQRTAGERIQATVVRDKAMQEVTVIIEPYSEDIFPVPENTIGKPADYIVVGGLIFRELTQDYLEGFGDRWQRRADINLTWHAFAAATLAAEPGKRTVILVGVLADPINIGLRELRHRIVTGVNGHAVQNLADLAARLHQDGLSSVTLHNMEAVPIRFNPEEVESANQRIQARFQIPAMQRLSTGTTSQPR